MTTSGFDITRGSHLLHNHITPDSLTLHTLITEIKPVMEVFSIMDEKRVRWETMDKTDIQLSKLGENYVTTCRTEGKTTPNLCG